MSAKRSKPFGRPRTVDVDAVPINVKIPRQLWLELQARADKRTVDQGDAGPVVTVSDLVREALQKVYKFKVVS